MEKTLIMLCGCPGSGKSTWTQQYKENKKVVIISRDEIRFRLVSENEEYFSKENQVFNIFISEINKALQDTEHNIIIIDATHISRKSRAKVLNRLNLSNITLEAITFHPSLNECLERNKQREGRARIPDSAIINMYKNYQKPEHIEGFDTITRFYY